jgi:hypothetical protein
MLGRGAIGDSPKGIVHGGAARWSGDQRRWTRRLVEEASGVVGEYRGVDAVLGEAKPGWSEAGGGPSAVRCRAADEDEGGRWLWGRPSAQWLVTQLPPTATLLGSKTGHAWGAAPVAWVQRRRR